MIVQIIVGVVIGLLSITVGVLIYAVINVLRKLEVYEEWVDDFQNEIRKVYVRMKELDDREMFSKDDDVGVAFSEILRIINEFDKRIK